jgi:hypothetical protein
MMRRVGGFELGEAKEPRGSSINAYADTVAQATLRHSKKIGEYVNELEVTFGEEMNARCGPGRRVIWEGPRTNPGPYPNLGSAALFAVVLN